MENLDKEIALIKDPEIRKSVESYMKKCVAPEFWTAPASSTGKYHPAISLGKGGLVRHTKLAVRVAEDLIDNLNDQFFLKSHKDEIIASLIMHDTKKNGDPWGKHAVHEHPILASEAFIQHTENIFYGHKMQRIAANIATHMGKWSTSGYSEVILPEPNHDTEEFVHLCDYIASRKWEEEIGGNKLIFSLIKRKIRSFFGK